MTVKRSCLWGPFGKMPVTLRSFPCGYMFSRITILLLEHCGLHYPDDLFSLTCWDSSYVDITQFQIFDTHFLKSSTFEWEYIQYFLWIHTVIIINAYAYSKDWYKTWLCLSEFLGLLLRGGRGARDWFRVFILTRNMVLVKGGRHLKCEEWLCHGPWLGGG